METGVGWYSEPGGSKSHYKHDFLNVYVCIIWDASENRFNFILSSAFRFPVLNIMNHSLKVMPNGSHWKLPAICASLPVLSPQFPDCNVGSYERPSRVSPLTLLQEQEGIGAAAAHSAPLVAAIL